MRKKQNILSFINVKNDIFSSKKEFVPILISKNKVVRILENLEMSGNFFLVRENLEKSGNFVEITPNFFSGAFLTYSVI